MYNIVFGVINMMYNIKCIIYKEQAHFSHSLLVCKSALGLVVTEIGKLV